MAKGANVLSGGHSFGFFSPPCNQEDGLTIKVVEPSSFSPSGRDGSVPGGRGDFFIPPIHNFPLAGHPNLG